MANFVDAQGPATGQHREHDAQKRPTQERHEPDPPGRHLGEGVPPVIHGERPDGRVAVGTLSLPDEEGKEECGEDAPEAEARLRRIQAKVGQRSFTHQRQQCGEPGQDHAGEAE